MIDKTTAINRRHEIRKLVYNIWTNNGSDLSGLAAPLTEGRIDQLCDFVLGVEDDELFTENWNETTIATIDRFNCRDLSYQQFVQNYMKPNQPVIIQGLADGWPATTLWVQNDGTPDMKYLAKTFGSDIAPVHEQKQSGFGPSRPISRKMSVSDYANWWFTRDQKQHDNDNDVPLLYLKDWKFVAAHPAYHAYDWPVYFRDDWLNQAMCHAYKFVYLGPKGTSTILHADVLRSFSWSTNVCGRKRWYLVPPEYTFTLYDCFGKTLAIHLHIDMTQDGRRLPSLFPGLEIARRHAIQVDQSAGETIFIPSNWFHTVENLEDTLSINHNWLNGFNLHLCWQFLESQLKASQPKDTVVERNADGRAGEDNSQIEDDIILIMQVLSEKAKATQHSYEKHQKLDSDEISNLESMEHVIQGLSDFARRNHGSYLASRIDNNLEIVMRTVKSML